MIASSHRRHITSAETLSLLPKGTFESVDELEHFVSTDQVMREHLVVQEGVIVPKGDDKPSDRAVQAALSESRSQLARGFASGLARWCPWIRLVGISGSTAYGAAMTTDDIDLFIVTGRNRLWVTLTIAMALARIRRLRDPAAPVYCLNRVLEETECRAEFRMPHDPLFARDALSLRVVEGFTFYRGLLESAPWMEKIFPALYRQASSQGDTSRKVAIRPEVSVWFFANAIAFSILSPYLATVSMWRNRRLMKGTNFSARFRTVIKYRFFATESEKYEALRAIYRKAFG